MIEQIFNPESSRNFQLFLSPGHLTFLVIFLLSVIWLFTHRNKPYMRRIRWVFFAALVLSEISLLTWTLYFDRWDIMYNLPLQLCTINLLLSAYMLLMKSYRVFEIIYFFGIGGALQALLTPDLFYTFPHFRFFHFFIAHIVIILAILYMIWVNKFHVTWISAIKSFVILNIFAFFVFWVNQAIGSNYMFLARKPSGQSILDWLGPYPWYILSLEAIAILMFALLYLPFYIKKLLYKDV
ncbi:MULTISPECIES: TIGR02206 family membrane protein [Bacillaceae]|uniref:TIGR02206 family membrane protein n=1 Tax=Evansella alkalicola TaxID=745819 RepID=A0ABS6JU41_9BACI|nr:MULTISPECIES: TIGR02206 family membrane protein [Bacillaceae]MBU9722061.1 TIGR02206 family membrane protein [Bacillus alkalicola]